MPNIVTIMSTILVSIIKILFGVLIFVGVPLIGWGVTDIQGFAEQPARLAYVVLVVLLQIGVVIMIPEVGRNAGKGKKTVSRQRVAVLLLQVISIAIVIAAPYSDHRDVATFSEITTIRYLGLFLFAFGFCVVNWAEATLGKQFSIQVTIQSDHKIITNGPYRFLRHPRYLGIILFNVGISLIFRSWLAIILVAALTLALLWRIQDEEALMCQEFGSDWETYAKKSWRLIPFIY